MHKTSTSTNANHAGSTAAQYHSNNYHNSHSITGNKSTFQKIFEISSLDRDAYNTESKKQVCLRLTKNDKYGILQSLANANKHGNLNSLNQVNVLQQQYSQHGYTEKNTKKIVQINKCGNTASISIIEQENLSVVTKRNLRYNFSQ